MVRGCSTGPCPEPVVETGSHGAHLQAVTPATHLTTAVAAKEARYEDMDFLPSAVPQEQTKIRGGEEVEIGACCVQLGCGDPTAVQGQESGREFYLEGTTCCSFQHGISCLCYLG